MKARRRRQKRADALSRRGAAGRRRFRQRDVTAAIKAVRAAGCAVARAEIEPENGRIVVVIGEPEQQQGAKDQNEWDAV